MWGYFCGAGWLPVSAGMKGKKPHWKEMFVHPSSPQSHPQPCLHLCALLASSGGPS